MVVLEGTTGSAPANDRAAGFDDAIKGTQIKKIASQTGDFTRDGGKKVMEGFLQKYGVKGIDLVFAHNDDMALGAIEAIEAAGGKPGNDIHIVSIDGVHDGMQALIDGKINYIVECNPLLGDQAADLVKKVLAGTAVEKKNFAQDGAFTKEQAKAASSTPRRTDPSALHSASKDCAGAVTHRPPAQSHHREDRLTQMPVPHREPHRSSRCAGSPSASPASWRSTTSTSCLRAGEVHALMGENGAGKSTLIKALTGVYAIDHGSITVAGADRGVRLAPATRRTPASRPSTKRSTSARTSRWARTSCSATSREARAGSTGRPSTPRRHATSASLGLHLDTQSLLSSHSIAVQQLVAISRAMVLDARVLILDEPTSSLDREEVDRLFAVVRDLRDKGVAILFVSHFLDQVYEIADRITVLRNGQLVGEYRDRRTCRARSWSPR